MVRRILLIALSGVALSACSQGAFNDERQAVSPQERFPIVIEPQVVSLDLPAVTAMSEESRDKLKSFASAYRAGGYGAVTVTGGVGTRAALGAAADALASAGVPGGAIVVTTQSQAAGGVTLSFVRRGASSPACGDWSENANETFRNAPMADFGCATQNNLAKMVSDPRDLENPRDSDPADAARRANVLEKWRRGESTATPRTDDERANVSTVE